MSSVSGRDVTAKPLIYLAGPYSHPDPVANTHAVVMVAEEIMREGKMIPLIPHLSMLWHAIVPHEVEFWYEYDLHLLARCDAVLRIPGESTGADREMDEAWRLGLPVFRGLDDLRLWLTSWRLAAR